MAKTKTHNKGLAKRLSFKEELNRVVKLENKHWDLFCNTVLGEEDWDSAVDRFPKQMTRFLFQNCVDLARGFYIDTVVETWERRIEEKLSDPMDRKNLLNNLINSVEMGGKFSGLSRKEQKQWTRWGAEQKFSQEDQRRFDRCRKDIADEIDEFIGKLMTYGKSVHEAWCKYIQELVAKHGAEALMQSAPKV
jgi:hypothetical protein